MAKKETLVEKANKAGLPVQTVYNRMHAGWSEKKALSVPNRAYNKKSKKSIIADNTSTPKPTVKPVERKVPPTVPLPVEKYEAPKDRTFLYVVVACAVLLGYAMTTT